MRTFKTSILATTLATLPSLAFAQETDALSTESGPGLESEPAREENAAADASAAASAPAPAPNNTPRAAPTATASAAPAATPAPPPSSNTAPSGPATRSGPGGGAGWTMSYSGYLRAPMRVGVGNDTLQSVPAGGSPVGPMSLHYPVIPDDQYGSWQFTGHNRKDWAEMFFTVGNGTASGTVAIQGFQFTDAAWKQNNSQFGIGQGWVEVTSDLGFENIKFNAKAGNFWARYGMAGVYDAGEYDTYIIGRTHTMGGLGKMAIDLGTSTLTFEGGFGAKQPNPEMFNRARFTPMAHIHAMYKNAAMELGLHTMYAWADQGVVPIYPNVVPGSNCEGINYAGDDDPEGDKYAQQCIPNQQELNNYGDLTNSLGYTYANPTPGVFGPQFPNGSQLILGADARLDLGLAGYLYGGFSQQFLKNALVVGSAIEAIHSFGGAEYKNGVVDNYLESPFCDNTNKINQPGFAPNQSCSQGNGGVSTIMAQYELGLGNFGIFPGAMDLKFKLYGMANFVQVPVEYEERYLDDIIQRAEASGINRSQVMQNGTMKLKFGVDAEFFLNDYISLGTRFDRVQPHSKIAEQTFMILSPRITFRSHIVTHETISLSYSRYFYNQRYCRDGGGNFVSPADSPFREIGGTNPQNSDFDPQRPVAANGLWASVYCVQPAPGGMIPQGFGATSDNQQPGLKGAPTLLPDENVIKLEASMWW